MYFLNWSIVDLQCCVSFRCTAQWFSFIYICVYVCIYIYICIFFFRFFSLISYYKILSIVPWLAPFLNQIFAPSIPIIYAVLNFNIVEKISEGNMIVPLCRPPDFLPGCFGSTWFLKYNQDMSGYFFTTVSRYCISHFYIVRFPTAREYLLLTYIWMWLSSFCSGLLFRNLSYLCLITPLCS